MPFAALVVSAAIGLFGGSEQGLRDLLNGKHCRHSRHLPQLPPTQLKLTRNDQPTFKSQNNVTRLALLGKPAVPFHKWQLPCIQPAHRETTKTLTKKTEYSPVKEVCPSLRPIKDTLKAALDENNLVVPREDFYSKLKEIATKPLCWPDANAANNREQCMAFNWGHTFSIGNVKARGFMRDRWAQHLALFVDYFGFPASLEGKHARVMDIGPWTGASSYMWAALGASEVVSVEDQPITRQVLDPQ